jgi:autotransporter passenger strand-loop-strand repeat protein
MAQYDIVKGVKSSGIILNENDHMFVSKGGTATSTSVDRGRLNIFSGGKTLSTWVNNNGLVTVYSGGRASLTTLSNTFASMYLSGGTAIQIVTYPNGWLNVYSGGLASLGYVFGGSMTVFAGGSAVDTDLDRNGIAHISSGGIMKNTRISSYEGTCGKLHVSYGGIASMTTVFSGGSMFVSNGGTATMTTVSAGSMIVSNGATANSTTVSGGSMVVSNGGAASGATVMGSGKMIVSSNGKASGVTVSTGGSVFISSGGTASAVTLKDGYLALSAGASVANLKLIGGSLFIGKGANVNSVTNKKGVELTIEKGAVINNYSGAPIAFPDCDTGWNNYLYNRKKTEAPLNEDVVYNTPAAALSSQTKSIQMDNNGVSCSDMTNYVGYGDEADFMKISLSHAATLSFILTATGAAKFTIWSLTSDTKMKSLQTTTLKKDSKTGQYRAETKGILLKSDTYYISVESTTAKKGGNAYYDVTLNNNKSVFYVKGNDFDNAWYSFNEEDYSGKGYLGVVNGKKENLVSDEWVGYGDEVDFRKFKLTTAAKLSFAIISTDKVKFSICRVNSKKQQNDIVTFSLKTIQTTTVKKLEDKQYFVTTAPLMLDPGYYYIRVESTNAKKGGDADYTVNLNMEKSVFFDKGNSEDDWTDKSNGWINNKKYECQITASTTNLVKDEWVGYNDEIDFRKFTLKTDAKLSFDVLATDKVKFIIYKLNKVEKTYSVTYSLAKIQTTSLGANEWNPTKAITLKAGEYYFSVQSTNAKKGGNAAYDVSVFEFTALPLEDSLSCALTGPEETADPVDDASAFADAFMDSGFESAEPLSGVGLQMSGASGDLSVSPELADASGGIVGLMTADCGEGFSCLASPDGLPKSDTLFSGDASILA